jgi:hypothetical protein
MIWTLYIYVSKDVRKLGYFLKPQEICKQKILGNTDLEEHIPNEHALIIYVKKNALDV